MNRTFRHFMIGTPVHISSRTPRIFASVACSSLVNQCYKLLQKPPRRQMTINLATLDWKKDFPKATVRRTRRAFQQGLLQQRAGGRLEKFRAEHSQRTSSAIHKLVCYAPNVSKVGQQSLNTRFSQLPVLDFLKKTCKPLPSLGVKPPRTAPARSETCAQIPMARERR